LSQILSPFSFYSSLLPLLFFPILSYHLQTMISKVLFYVINFPQFMISRVSVNCDGKGFHAS
ncbi:hypothetical protein KSS87_015331, partial [Heliosperma pusillum]